MGSVSEVTNMALYFHPTGTPGKSLAAIEGKEITPVFLDSSVDK